MLPYLLLFFRLTIGLLFIYSFLGKVRDVDQFAQTITNFKLLPERWSQLVALLFLMGELTVVVFVLIGGQWLSVAFGLAIFLLTAFTAALASVLVRNIQTTCNCFGSDEKPISHHDAGRNLGLLFIAAAGFWMSSLSVQTGGGITVTETVLMSLAAIIFLLIWLNLRDVLQLFQIA